MNAPSLTVEHSTPAYFRQYGKAFQEKIFQGLVSDKDWAQQMSEVMQPHFFDLKYRFDIFLLVELLVSNLFQHRQF